MTSEAFDAFYRRYYRLVLTAAQQRLPPMSDAEGVTSEVFRITWQHWASGHGLSLPWTYQVLRNVVGNEYRRVARADRFQQVAGPILARVWPDDEHTDDAREIRQAVSRLRDEDVELLRMAYWEDLSAREVGRMLGCSAGAARVRLLRARQRLRAQLEEAARREKEVADG